MIRNIFEGSEFLLYDIDNNPIALSKNCALKLKQNLVDITTKDSDGWKENLTSIKDWSIDFEGLISYDDNKFNTAYFLSQFENSEPFFIQFGVIQNGFTHTFWGEVALESIDLYADSGEVASYSGNLKGLGQLGFTNQGTPAQSGYLKTETDPVFRGSASFNITETNKNDWFDAYNKTLTEVGFNTVGNKTTLNVKLRDGSVYSTFFNQTGGSGSADLSGYYTSIQSDSKFQPLGNYVGNQYLSDYYYNKTEADSRYLMSVDWSIIGNKPALFNGNYNDLFNKPFIPTNVSQLVNDAGYVNASIINGLASVNFVGNGLNAKANVADVYTKAATHSLFHPLENQRLSTGNDVAFNRIKAVNELVIPAASSATNQSIWLGEAGNNNCGGNPSIISYLKDLQDVALKNLADGESLVYNAGAGKWLNKKFAIAADYALANGSNANGNWGINITGNANSATHWNRTLVGDFNSVTGFALLEAGGVYTANQPVINEWGQGIQFSTNNNPAYANQLVFHAGGALFTRSKAGGGFSPWDRVVTQSQLGANAYQSKTHLSEYVNDLGNYGGWLPSDGASYAGFAGNDVNAPYMRHTDSTNVVFLARKAELGALAYENKVYKHYSIDNQHYYIKHSWDGTGWNLRTENDVADEQANIHLVNINGKSENSSAWNGQRYSTSELTTPSTWFLGYDANTGEWKPTGKNVINSFLGLGSAAFKDENSWLKPSNHPNTAANYNFAIGTDGTRNFIQSHSGLELQINPLGNKVVLNNATVLNDLVIPATPSGANQSIWLGAAGTNNGGGNPSIISYLRDLQDVSFNNLQNGQSISYDSSTGKWKNTNYQLAGNYALTDGSNAAGTWAINISGNAGSSNYINSPDGSRNPNDIFARNNPNRVRFDFVNAGGNTTTGGNYAGVMTYSPWSGTIASTGDASYQLAFGSSEANEHGVPQLRIRKGIETSWYSWYKIYTSANIAEIKSDLGLGSLAYRNNINGNEAYTHINDTPLDIGIAKMLRWRNYGNGHAIFDASAGLAPNGVAIDNVNAQIGWSATFPTLMGWNGASTYGVRVDSARLSDRAGIANQLASYNGSNTIYWGWDGGTINFKIDNSNYGNTLPVHISGKAADSSKWDGQRYDGNDVAVNTYLMAYGADGAWHPTNVGNVRSYLNLGSAAYLNASTSHNSANTVVQRDSNGYLGANDIYVGFVDKYLSTILNEETLDKVASRNNNLYRPLHIRDGNQLQIWNNAGPYYGARWDMRNDTIHKYVTRASDESAVAWKENWWDGAGYHSLEATSTGFYSGSRWRIGGGTGDSFSQATIEVLGNGTIRPRIGFHMQGVVASSLTIANDGTIEVTNNPGTAHEKFRASQVEGTILVGGGRIFTGYDSGVAGSVSASNWFRSNGASGWFSSDYGGGIFMQDSTWVRVYGSKGFWVDNSVRATDYTAANKGYYGTDYGNGGLVGLYDPNRYQPVFTMGDSWTMAGNGTSLQNHYGIAWTHQNVGGQSKAGLGHQALFTEAGITQTAIGNGIWTRANIYAVGHIHSGTGTNGGFSNLTYNQGHNNIWRLSTDPEYGIAYYQAWSGANGYDAIGFHFGNRQTPAFYATTQGDVKVSNSIQAPVIKATSAMILPTVASNINGAIWIS